jgi:hypothetical protein
MDEASSTTLKRRVNDARHGSPPSGIADLILEET